MKFVLFCEGYTEHAVLQSFLKRWLDPKLKSSVGISSVRFDGWAELKKDSPTKAKLYLAQKNVIAVIALLDLNGPTIYPADKTTAKERYDWGKKKLEGDVAQPKFFQFFAVHEVEAWLLSDPEIFPPRVRASLATSSRDPESVDNHTPPAKLLKQLYKQHAQRRREYSKVVDGRDLFGKLDPNTAYDKCPRLKELLDKMLELAKAAEH